MAVRVGGIVRQTSTKQSKELVQEELLKELPPLKEPQPQQKEATKIHAQKIVPKNDAQKVALKKSCLKCLTQKISELKKCKQHELKLEINNIDCSFFIYNHQARVVQISNQVNLRRKFDG